jgi:plasmid stabilization system protein ParE
MKVIWEDEAIENLGDIYEFLFDRSCEEVADKTVSIISEGVSYLAVMPFMGKSKGSDSRRFLVLSKVQYVVPYDIDESTNTIKILKIIYQKKQRNF